MTNKNISLQTAMNDFFTALGLGELAHQTPEMGVDNGRTVKAYCAIKGGYGVWFKYDCASHSWTPGEIVS